MEDLNLLRQVPYFSHLEEPDLRVLAEVGYEEHYSPDSIIIDEGDIKNSIYFIVEGKVKVSLEKISGRELTLSLLRKGDLFGEGCLIGESPSPKVVALEDTTVVRFGKNDFLRGISNDPIILANILRESGFKSGHDIKLREIENEEEEESKLQREISIFEKRFAIELEGIKLISKKIEDLSNDTSAYIKDKSEETISWVEQRSREAIESSERRSREVTEHAERQAQQVINSAEKSIAKALEEDKTQTEVAIHKIEDTINSVRGETEAALKRVDVFWNNIKRSVIFLSSAIAILGSVLVWLGYPEFKRVTEIKHIREELIKDREEIRKIKNDVDKEFVQFQKNIDKFREKLFDLAALEALVLNINSVTQESRLERDDIDQFRRANISYSENRKKLFHYISSVGYEEHKPEVVVAAVNSFLKLINYSDDKLTENEKDSILKSCRWSLANLKGRDYRYRIKNRENLIIFGQILQRRKSGFYNEHLIPTLNSILKGPEFDPEEKFTVAESLAALGEHSKDCIDTLVGVMKNDKISHWRRYSAAVGLVYLQDKRGRDYLFTEMEPYKENRLIAALSLGEAMARSDTVKLNDADRQGLIARIEEGIHYTTNQFRKDYATAILKALKEKDKLRHNE
jgi:CRP-like cAMP-binding protein